MSEEPNIGVRYDAPPKALPKGLPTPRLQLRWETTPNEPDGYEALCHYELVFALSKHDIRDAAKTRHAVVTLGLTRSKGGRAWEYESPVMRTPIRDGAHASWDSAALGGLPVFVIAPDGNYTKVEEEAEEDEA